MASRHQEAVRLRNQSEHRRAWEIDKEIVGSYKASMSKDEKLLCLEALYGCIDDSFAFADYPAAARYMVLAEEIRDSENIHDSRIDIYYSCMYIVMANHSQNLRIYAKAYPHALKAFDLAVNTKDRRKMELSFFHIIGILRTLDLPGSKETMDSVKQIFIANTPDSISSEIFKRYYNATMFQYIDKDDERAALEYDTILAHLPPTPAYARKRATFMLYAAAPRISMGKYQQAEKYLKKALEMADSLNQASYKLMAYSTLTDLELERGDSAKAREYQLKHDSLNYAISSFPIAGDIYTLDQINEEKELHHQISIARYHSHVSQWVSVFIAVVLVIVMSFIFVLRHKNKSLKERARLLHELLRAQSAHDDLESRGDEVIDTKTKYSGSTLSDEEKKAIARDVSKVLGSDAVFSPEFSLSSLAEEISRSPKAVSQVINELFNSNFSTLVNRKRIFEACRRMDSPDYSNWSIEGIAGSVGYTQRNTFSTNFKKFTGMGIREYRKLSKEEKNHLSDNISEE